MSTPNPFQQEERSQLETMPLWNPETAQPKWYDGLGFSEDTAYLGPLYRLEQAEQTGIAKGAQMLTGLWHLEYSALAHVPGLRTAAGEMASETEDANQLAREWAKRNTPDPATTGTAAQIVHSVVSGATRVTLGSLAGGPLGGAALMGGSEATSRFQELHDQGVDMGTAAASASVAGVTSGAGALIPGGFGSGLFTRLLTGAGANVGMGVAGRYADHKILEAGGYQEMADQQRVWDGTQVAIDAILGAAFGGVAHIHATQEARAEQAHQALLRALPAWGQAAGATDAARTLQVALRDRAAAPGVPVDPASAAAHQAALEKAQTDLLAGERVNVADTGVHDAQFLSRPSPHAALGEEIVGNALREAGVLDEEHNLKDLEEALASRLRGERPAERIPVQTPAEAQPTGEQAPLGRASGFLSEFEQTHPENPNEPTERLVNGNVRVELVTDPTDPTTAHIQSVRALQTGEGAGTKAMENIVELADKHNTRLTLQADPLDVNGIGSRKLVDWYKRFGFRITHHVGEGALMERPPGGAPEAALLPEPHELESVGAEHTLDNAYAAALTARAAQLEPDRVWQLAEKHDGDTEGFIREVQAIVDQHEAARAGSEEGAAATAVPSSAGKRRAAAGGEQPATAATATNSPTGAAARGATPTESAADRLAAGAITDRSGIHIPDDDGNIKPAQQALQQTDTEAALGEQETPKAITAAIDCFLRRGG